MKQLLFSLLLVFATTSLANGQHNIYQEDKSQIKNRDAILVLPGMEGNKKRRKLIFQAFKNSGYDIFVLDYIDRNSIENTRDNVRDFFYNHNLNEYKNLHCFTYIMGTWSLNDFIQKNGFENIKTIISDRSPPQERAPAIAKARLNWIVKIVKGKIINQLEETPYPAIENPSDVNFGIIIENKPTTIVKLYKKTALSFGPISMDVDSLNQSYDDFMYVMLDHVEMYSNFDIIGESIFCFIEKGRFPANSKREPIAKELFKN